MPNKPFEHILSRSQDYLQQKIQDLLPERVPIAVRMALAITLLIVGGMSMLGLMILTNQKNILSKQVIDMGSTVTSQLADSAREPVLSDDNLSIQTLITSLLENNHILGVSILSEKQIPLASSGTNPDNNNLQKHLKYTNPSIQTGYFEWNLLNDDNLDHDLITFISLIAGHSMVTFTKHTMMQSMQDARNTIVVVTILMSIVAIYLAFVMSKHLSQPIYNLVDASKAIGDGDFYYRLNERRNDEIGELALAFNQMADGLLKKSQVETIFSRYVSRNVAKEIMSNLEGVELGGKHVNASVLFADIVGFTSMSEQMPAQQITQLLNEYFSYISKISSLYNGHIDKFMGDCAMVVFGVPEHDPAHCFNALACAILIQKLVVRLNEIRAERDLIAINFRIGINTGNMVAGNLGSHDRMEYTVIGDPVNLASRLSSVAQSGQIVIMDELYHRDDISSKIVAHPYKTLRVRGKEKPVSTYIVEGLNENTINYMDEQIRIILEEYIL